MADERPPLIQHSGQSGDHDTHAAGRDIIHSNDPALWLAFIRDQLWQSDQRRDMHQAQIVDRLERQEDMLRAHELMEQRRKEVEAKERAERQAELDRQLTIQRRWLAGLTIALFVALIVLGWLTVDRFAALSLLRYVAGGALAWGLFRGRP